MTGNLTVPFGVTLTIAPGTEVNVVPGSVIEVSGTLNAQGTASEPIIFTSIIENPQQNQYWGKLRILGGSSIMEYCTVEYSNYGLAAECDMTVNSCTFSNNKIYGIYSKRKAPAIQNCTIHDNYYGIYVYQANQASTGNILISGNQIYDNTYGIYLSDSSPDIRSNNIELNWQGIKCYGNSDALLGDVGYYGNNIITDHSTVGVYAYNSSPFLGEDMCVINGGNNQITECGDYLVYAASGSYVTAENNWWGSSTPVSTDFYAQFGSYIDYTPWLTSAPSKAAGTIKSPEEEFYDLAFDKYTSGYLPNGKGDPLEYFNENWTLRRKLNFARNLTHLGYAPATWTICRNILQNHPDSSLAEYALDLIYEAARHQSATTGYQIPALRILLTTMAARSSDKPVYARAALYLAQFLGKNGLPILDRIVSNWPEHLVAERALYEKFQYYLLQEENADAAEQVLAMLAETFPNSVSQLDAQEMYLLITGQNPNKELLKKIASQESIPENFELRGNYPNPFNPTTRISFAVPVAAKVKIVIYDLLGKKVRVIEVSHIEPGNHEIYWNGRNELGELVHRGMYIYKFTAEALDNSFAPYEKSMKMLLVK